MYLTPDRLRTMGLGIDLSDMSNIELRSAIMQASTLVDTFCAVPMVPTRFSFLGGTVVDEKHQMRTDAWSEVRPFQFFPKYGPIQEVTDFRIMATNDIDVEIEVENIVINNDEGYIEVASLNLTQFGVFGAGLVPLIGLYYPIAKWSLRYGYAFAVTDEVVESTDARTYRALNQFWTDDAVTVKVNGVDPGSVYTLDRTEGVVIFSANRAAEDVVTVSYTHKLPTDIQTACGLILADILGESDLRAKGMGGLAEIQVQDVRLRRAPNSERNPVGTPAIPDDAAQILTPWVHVTVR